MKRFMLFLGSLFIICLLTNLIPAQTIEKSKTKLTPAEAAEVRKVVHDLFISLEETKDFEPLIEKYFSSKFPVGSFFPPSIHETADLENIKVVYGANLQKIDKQLFDQLPVPLLRRYQVATYNVFYSLFFSPVEDEIADQEFRTIQKNFLLAAKKIDAQNNDDHIIRSVKQVQNITTTFENFGAQVRKYIAKYPDRTKFLYDLHLKENKDLWDVISTPAISSPDGNARLMIKSLNLSQNSRIYEVEINSKLIVYLTREQNSIKVIAFTIIPQ